MLGLHVGPYSFIMIGQEVRFAQRGKLLLLLGKSDLLAH